MKLLKKEIIDGRIVLTVEETDVEYGLFFGKTVTKRERKFMDIARKHGYNYKWSELPDHLLCPVGYSFQLDHWASLPESVIANM